MRNVDSKIHAARFDRFKFLFHSFAVATFATISALLRHHEAIRLRPLRRVKAVVRPDIVGGPSLTQLGHEPVAFAAMHGTDLL
jgi:hypothetical protein